MKKYLPIKFYQKREEQDDRFTPGISSSELPKWVLSGDDLKERVNSLIQEMGDVVSVLQNRPPEFDYIPAIISVELDDHAIAKSHRSSIKEIFNYDRESKIIGFNNESELLVRIDSPKEAIKVQSKIRNTQKHVKGVSAITEIKTYNPKSFDFDPGKCDVLKASLFNYYDYPLNETVKSAFIDFCTAQEIILKETHYSDDLIIFRLEGITSEEKYQKILDFPAVQFIEPMPYFKLGLDSNVEEVEVELKVPQPDTDYPVVGVLDSGIADIPFLTPWIDGHESVYPEDLLDKSHGTFVGGIITYGDDLEKAEFSGLKGCKLFDATVMPDPKKERVAEDELIENIREIIEAYPDIKIWNLSLGYESLEVDDCNFSQFAMALDDIQKDNDVIICKSAGNCDNFASNKPVGRITVPSDSVLSLVIGSVSLDGSPSVFSRTGSGPAHINKPDLVSYGGNFIKSGGRFIKDGVKSFSVDNNVYDACGTSFSTPRVSALLAGLSHEIQDEFDPLLLKALTIHSAKYPENVRLTQLDRVKLMGYGIPDNLGNILYNSDHEITLIQSDRLVKGRYVEILEFPYPDSLIDEKGYYYGDVTVTLVSTPVLFSGNGVEYCQSDIDVKFGTFDEIAEKEVTRSHKNEYGPDSLANLLLPDKYRSRSINNSDYDNPFVRERTLLNYGKKYQPVKKWRVNLNELTPANKEKYLKSPKKWGLRLTGVYRDFAETRAGLDRTNLYQDFCLIITIKDPNNQRMVYNEVTQLLESRNFIHSDIQLRETIQERVRV